MMTDGTQPAGPAAAEAPAGAAEALRDLDAQLSGSLEQTDKLISLIRETAGFSLDQHGGLLDGVGQVADCLAEVLSVFCGRKLKVEAGDIALLDEQIKAGEDAPPLCCARVEIGEDDPLCFAAVAPAQFRQVLNAALGVGGAAGDGAALSFSEEKLFLRFVDRLANALFVTLEHLGDATVPGRPSACPAEDIVEFGSGGEAVFISLAALIDAAEAPFHLIFPLHILEPDAARVTGEAAATTAEDGSADRGASLATGWGRRMQEVVTSLNIPLVAELAAQELPLAEVERLETGPLPGFEFAMDGLRILDAEMKPVMLANLRIRDGGLELQVVSQVNPNAV